MLRSLAPLLLLLVAACDPCAGIGTCSAPLVRYTGTVMTPFADYPARDVRVEFVRTGGVSLESQALTAVTDTAGRFVLEGRARDEGAVTGDLVLHAPSPIPPVTVSGVTMETARAPGDVRQLGRFQVQYPHFSYRGQLFHRNNGQPPAEGLEVEFRRTGGIPIRPDSFVVRSDKAGYFDLRPRTSVTGVVVGDLTVRALPPYQPFVVRGVRLATSTVSLGDSIIRVGIGWGLPYSGILVWDSNGRPAGGIPIEMRRKGGVRIHPEVHRTTTDPHGTFLLDPAPLERGELLADVVAILPPPHGEHVLIRDLRLPTTEDDHPVRLLGYYGVPGGPDDA